LLIWNRRGISRVRKFFYHDVKTAIQRLLRKSTESGESPPGAPLPRNSRSTIRSYSRKITV
jgi:hypothetical protein